MDHLYNHPLVALVNQRISPVFVEAAERVHADPANRERIQLENRERMTPSQRYDRDVGQRNFGLLGACATVRAAIRLLGIAPATAGVRPETLSRDSWADYHFGVFTVSQASIPDIGLVLTGAVFQIGLPPRLCSFDVVTHHTNVQGTPVRQALKELRKVTQVVTQRRHGHVHRGEFADVRDLGSDDFIESLKMLTWLSTVTDVGVDRAMLRAAWREAIGDIAPRLNTEAEEVERRVAVLLDELLPHYRARAEALDAFGARR